MFDPRGGALGPLGWLGSDLGNAWRAGPMGGSDPDAGSAYPPFCPR